MALLKSNPEFLPSWVSTEAWARGSVSMVGPTKKEPDREDGLFRGLQDLQIGEEILKAETVYPPGIGQEGKRCQALARVSRRCPPTDCWAKRASPGAARKGIQLGICRSL